MISALPCLPNVLCNCSIHGGWSLLGEKWCRVLGRGRPVDAFKGPLNLPTTDGTLSHQVDTIQCIDTWFVTLVTVSAVLIAASVVPLILRFCTHAPAFSLLVSTMLKDSPYFEAPNTGSTLESSDRSRLLKHRRVRFGDVAPSDDIGYLAVASLSDDDDGVGKVGFISRQSMP